MEKRVQWTAIAISAAAILTLTGCGGSSDGTSETTLETTSYDVTVERGPVLHAVVMDDKGQRAVEVGHGQYRFSEEPAYPVVAVGGYIDVNRDGTVSAGDINNSVVLKAPEGKAATVVSTVAVRSEVRTWLKEQFGLTDEMIDDLTPSDDRTIAAISDEIYAYCIEEGIADPATLQLQQLEAIRDRVRNRIEAYLATEESTAELEEELVQALDLPVLDDTEVEAIRSRLSEPGSERENYHAIVELLPKYDLNDTQKQTLAYMWNEEKMAKDIYLALNAVTPHNTLYNIATRSETQHQAMVEALVKKYDLNVSDPENFEGSYSEDELRAVAAGEFTMPEIKELYDNLYAEGNQSLENALKVGCMVEVTDVNDLDADIEAAGDALDLVMVYKNLRSGSYNHYWAFDGALKALGVEEGCCSLGEEYCKSPEEYPVSRGNGHGDQNGLENHPGHEGTLPLNPGEGQMNHGNGGQRPDPDAIAEQTPTVTLSQELKQTLAYMWNEEKMAKDIYLALNAVTPHNTLYNIATRSETQHEAMVEALVEKYDLNVSDPENFEGSYSEEELRAVAAGEFTMPEIKELYDTLYAKGSRSLQDALEVGCMVEVTDVNDLDADIEAAAGVEDLVEVYTNLRSGSYNHYWAFDSALKALGVEEGCCSLGEEYCKSPEEYPATNRSGGGMHGR